jgi:uncharacterized protein (DUF1778 family)
MLSPQGKVGRTMGSPVGRLDYRVSPDVKQKIKQAAAMRGLSETSFAVNALVVEAERVIQSNTITTVSARDWERLNAMLQRDSQPSAHLRAAAARFKKRSK